MNPRPHAYNPLAYTGPFRWLGDTVTIHSDAPFQGIPFDEPFNLEAIPLDIYVRLIPGTSEAVYYVTRPSATPSRDAVLLYTTVPFNTYAMPHASKGSWQQEYIAPHTKPNHFAASAYASYLGVSLADIYRVVDYCETHSKLVQ